MLISRLVPQSRFSAGRTGFLRAAPLTRPMFARSRPTQKAVVRLIALASFPHHHLTAPAILIWPFEVGSFVKKAPPQDLASVHPGLFLVIRQTSNQRGSKPAFLKIGT
ncbi:hypothetical protein K438DRAFT_1977023 [Mycena galopus ATCC 62051]|nr:hypothetical protein K438DRAFT_1980919 [Mycena galopus ATCC 62051]KAF8180055.1 hypothetical protein K438DRAFT_1977023 [Mycena galopus ATCC 62051]